jgi:hypothetical protein
MTEERSHSDSVRDTLVSRTYREAAVERAPDDLNQAVLLRARQHSSNRYSRSVIWLRPMAWAATIGLCLAIVVEINNVPQPTPEQMALPAAPADTISDGKKLDEEAVQAIRTEGGAASSDMNEAVVPQRIETEALQQRARKTVDDQGRVSLQDVPQHSKSEARELKFVPAEIPVTCKAQARATPETWLACIEALEEEGLDEVAGEQREQLQVAFPDFDMP